MSNNRICREKYFSYGSYLLSRGYDKEICNLVTAIENGSIPLGSVIPSGQCGVTIKGTTTIQDCGDTGNTNNNGILKVLGGSDSDPSKFSITGVHGMNLIGSIYQNYGLDPSYSVGGVTYNGNYFSSPEHIFTDNDASTNVIIRGNLFVQGGSIVDLSSQDILESITINTFTGFQGNSLRIFHSPSAIGNIIRVDTDISSVAGSGPWENYLAFAVDGSDNQAGSTNTEGHLRALRGLTVMNPPPANQPIDISYDTNWLGTDKALDVYGKLLVAPGNNSAPAAIDLSNGDFNIRNGGTSVAYINSSGDASFNHLWVYDLSIANTFQVGTSTVYIDSNTVDAPNVVAPDASFTRLFVTDLSLVNDLPLPANPTFTSVTATDGSFTSLFVTDLSLVNLTVETKTYTEDISANTAYIGTIKPIQPNAFGISYESLSNTRQRYLFGEGFVLGDVSAQQVPPDGASSVVMGSQYLTFPPELLRVNAFFNSDIMKVETISSGQYLSLDVSNNKDDFIDSLVSFNSYLTIGGTNLDKLQQTVIFLHPNEILDCSGVQNGQGYWPSDASGDIIVDTRSIGTIPTGKTASLTYGTRHLYVPSTIPSTINSLSGDIYVPHIAFQFQNASSFTIFDGNLSMNQRVFK